MMADVDVLNLKSKNPSVCAQVGNLCPVKLEALYGTDILCVFMKRLETPDNRELESGSRSVEAMLCDSVGEKTD